MTNELLQLPVQRLTQLVERLDGQIHDQLKQSTLPPEQLQEYLLTLIEETRVSLEELRLADEEIHIQTEQLAEANSALAAERTRYHHLFEAAPVGYLITSRDGTIQEANHTAEQMLNVSRQHLAGKPLLDFIEAADRRAFRQNLLDVASTRKLRRWETHYQPRNGEARDLAVIAAPMDTGTSFVRDCIRWLLTDVTDQKLAETVRLEHFFRETFEHSPVGIGHIGFDGRWIRVNQALCELLGYSREELLERRIQDIAYSEDAPRLAESYRQIVDGVLPIIGLEMRCLSKADALLWVRLGISSVSNDHGHHAYGIAIMSDITESKRIAAAERRQRLLTEALRDTAFSLNSTLDFEEVLDQIMMVVGGVFSQTASMILLAENGHFGVVRAWGFAELVAGQLEKAVLSLRMPGIPEGIIRQMRSTLKPIIVNNWLDHGEYEAVPEISAICSFIAVPVISHEDLIGSLLLYSPQPDTFTAQEGEMLETFAAHAAVAIQNARAHQQARLLAAHEERQRLARDLHDAVTQSLFSASIISESLARRQSESDELAAGQMRELHLLTRGALAEMRTLLMELRPEYLLKSPLSTQIRQLGDALRSRKRVDIDFSFNGGGTLPDDVQISFYRVAQETFNNIVKHSQATHICVRLDASPEAVVLDISDDGIGFDPSVVVPGIGMTTMRERADAIRATLSIMSRPDGGTRVIMKWPA